MIPLREVSISLQTSNFPTMHHFYQELLGPPQREKAGAWAFFKAGSVALVLWANKQPCQQGESFQLVLNVAHLEQAAAALPEGATDGAIQQASHGRELFFSDPDGNRLILYQPHHQPAGV